MQLLGTHHIAVNTYNFAALERFYTETLGFRVTTRWDDSGIIFIDIGSTTIELIGKQGAAGEERPPERGAGTGLNHIALRVADVDDAAQELEALGIEIQVTPRNFQNIRIAFFSDPDGNVLELVEDPRKPEKNSL